MMVISHEGIYNAVKSTKEHEEDSSFVSLCVTSRLKFKG